MFITSSPTFVPSGSPITSMPSVSPSFLGLVVSVDITRPATGALSDSEISDLEALVAQAYGVESDDITSVTEYIATGTLDVNIPDDMSEEDALADLTTALATTLGLSEDQVTVERDAETGDITYSVASTDFDDASDVLALLQDSSVVDTINENSAVSISDVNADNDIVAQVTVVVDADEVTASLQQAENTFDALLPEEYNSDTEVVFVTSAPSTTPTIVPTDIPTSTVPTAVKNYHFDFHQFMFHLRLRRLQDLSRLLN